MRRLFGIGRLFTGTALGVIEENRNITAVTVFLQEPLLALGLHLHAMR